jgi:nicotinamidase-related amidase
MAQDNNNKRALLVIDVQDFYFPGGDMELKNPEAAAANVFKLIEHARESKTEVIFIKHKYEPGGNIYPSIVPSESEKVFTKTKINSFIGTGLKEYLEERDIGSVIICGMQTHMCVEAATRAAADLGYSCTLVHDACATRDLVFGDKTVRAEDVHAATLSTLKSYAKVVSTDEYIESFKTAGK